MAYVLRMDQQSAKELAEQGGTILLLDVPMGTHIGFDQQSFIAGPKFMGVKMLPPGAHLVSYNAAETKGSDFAPTVSFFLRIAPRQVHVRRWDPQQELLVALEEEEAERYAAGVRRFDFDQGLAPYDLHSFPPWQRLSGCITADVIRRLAPRPHGNLSITAEADPSQLQPATPAEERLDAQLRDAREARGPGREAEGSGPAAMQADDSRQPQPADAGSPGLQAKEGVGRSQYVQLPRLVKASGVAAAELSALNMDKSRLLEQVLAQHYGSQPALLLGELQWAFLAFLMGQSLEGFAQWKALLLLLLACEEAPLRTHRALFARFLDTLRQQLEVGLGQAAPEAAQQEPQLPQALPLVEDMLADSFLRQGFQQFFGGLADAAAAAPPQLMQQAEALQLLLRRRLQWDFRVQGLGEADEDDEYAPVVVSLQETRL